MSNADKDGFMNEQIKTEAEWFKGDEILSRESDEPEAMYKQLTAQKDPTKICMQTLFSGYLQRKEINKCKDHIKADTSRWSFEEVFNTKAKQYKDGGYSGYVTMCGRTLRFSDHDWQSSEHKKSEYNFGGVEGITISIAEKIYGIVYSVPDIIETTFIPENMQREAEMIVIEEQQKLGNTYIDRVQFDWRTFATLHFKNNNGVAFEIEVRDEKTTELELKNRKIHRLNRANTNKAIAKINALLIKKGLKTISEI